MSKGLSNQQKQILRLMYHFPEYKTNYQRLLSDLNWSGSQASQKAGLSQAVKSLVERNLVVKVSRNEVELTPRSVREIKAEEEVEQLIEKDATDEFMVELTAIAGANKLSLALIRRVAFKEKYGLLDSEMDECLQELKTRYDKANFYPRSYSLGDFMELG